MNWLEFCEQYIPAPATISVEAYQGSGPYGDVYAAPVDVTPCVVEDARRLVRAAQSETLSQTTVYAPLDTVAPVGSLITVGGCKATVLQALRHDAAGLPLPEHIELLLT